MHTYQNNKFWNVCHGYNLQDIDTIFLRNKISERLFKRLNLFFDISKMCLFSQSIFRKGTTFNFEFNGTKLFFYYFNTTKSLKFQAFYVYIQGKTLRWIWHLAFFSIQINTNSNILPVTRYLDKFQKLRWRLNTAI